MSKTPASKTKAPTPHVITANRLGDGLVVYRQADGTWSETYAEGQVMPEGADLDAALAAAKADEVAGVVGVYAHAVEGDAPAHIRERIRAQGPTVIYKTSPSAKAS